MRLHNYICLCLFVCFAFSAKAQIVNQPVGMEFKPASKFNPEFISKNKIVEIKAKVESKKDGDRIRSANLSKIFTFNPNGTVNKIAHINGAMGDTSLTMFEYDHVKLSCEVKNDAAGMYSYCYEYDDSGKPIALKYGRGRLETDVTASLTYHPVSEITTERFTYAQYDNQLHATLYNSSERPYIKEIRYYDSHNYLTKYLKTYIIGGARHEENYVYNEQGHLAQKTITRDSETYTLEYTYDEIGNLLEEKKIKDGKTAYRKEFVYDPQTMHLQAELKREDENEVIIITTYTYFHRR